MRWALGLSLLAACAGATPVDPPPAGRADAEPLPAPPPSGCGMDVRRLVADELARRPLAADDDVYKLVRQAILGPEGVAPDPVRGQAVLARELERAGAPLPGEPIVEDLDEVTGTVRLNLRKWRFVRGTAAELWPVLAGSAREMQADRGRLPPCLEDAAAALAQLGRDPSSFRARVQELSEQGYPGVPHSAAYLEAYRPAYRVVLRRLLPPWITAPPSDAG